MRYQTFYEQIPQKPMLVQQAYFWLTLYFYASPSVIVNLLAKYRNVLLDSFALFSCMHALTINKIPN